MRDSFVLLPILIFYIVPMVFIIWYMLKFLKVQQERNTILKTISEKLDRRL
ncbi:hypothetical protein [Bacillus sp. FJAT-27225]|uniref:hypothetical protein n=1 Tax=Bacillus sp. FJAT-27225 TaxID=1743144 RepID=UPI00158693BF|nr:hypothetical protein [Bacillus sp. FJAT-27225]